MGRKEMTKKFNSGEVFRCRCPECQAGRARSKPRTLDEQKARLIANWEARKAMHAEGGGLRE